MWWQREGRGSKFSKKLWRLLWTTPYAWAIFFWKTPALWRRRNKSKQVRGAHICFFSLLNGERKRQFFTPLNPPAPPPPPIRKVFFMVKPRFWNITRLASAVFESRGPFFGKKGKKMHWNFFWLFSNYILTYCWVSDF